jgi:hypothetical protein
MGYRENFEAITGDAQVRNRIRMALVAKAMTEADDATNVGEEQRFVRRVLDQMDETFLIELSIAVVGSFDISNVTDAQLDTRIGTVWEKLWKGFIPTVVAV